MDDAINLIKKIILDLHAKKASIIADTYETMNNHDFHSGYAKGKIDALTDQIQELEYAIIALRQRY